MDLTFEPNRLSMISRILLGSLLLLNLVVLLYLLFAEPDPVRQDRNPASYPAGQTLTLIRELDPSDRRPRQVGQERSFSPQDGESEILRCLAWGPFANAEVMAPVKARVQASDPAARAVSIEVEAPPDFLVYLDSDNNIDNARRILQELESQGIEAYVIAGGEYVNSVSAGVFSNREGAEELAGRLQDLGYSPALQSLERTQQVSYLLGRVPADFVVPEIEVSPCEAIAPLREFL